MNKVVIESVSQKKNSKKFVIKTNKDEYVMTEDTIIKFHIFKDCEFSEKEFDKIIYDIKISEVFNKVLNYLNYGPRSELEIRLYIQKNDKEKSLKSKDYDEIISRLKSLNYVNDELYAKQIVAYYKESKGKNYIKDFLVDKKIDKDIIEKVILDYEDEEELEVCYKIANKYLDSIRKYPFKKQQQMLFNKLMRSGFSKSILNKVVEKCEYKDESEKTLDRDILKLKKKLERKEISDYEKKQYVIKSLMSKGYSYKDILRHLN